MYWGVGGQGERDPARGDTVGLKIENGECIVPLGGTSTSGSRRWQPNKQEKGTLGRG